MPNSCCFKESWNVFQVGPIYSDNLILSSQMDASSLATARGGGSMPKLIPFVFGRLLPTFQTKSRN